MNWVSQSATAVFRQFIVRLTVKTKIFAKIGEN